MNGNCYTCPSDVELENPEVTFLNYMDYWFIHDDNFEEDCETIILHTIDEYCSATLLALVKELKPKSNYVQIQCCELQILKHFDNSWWWWW